MTAFEPLDKAEDVGRRLVGYRCMKAPQAGVIPLSAYYDPCPFDVPVYEGEDQ